MLLVADDSRDATTVVDALRAVWPAGLLVTQAQRVGDVVEELAERGATCVLLMLADDSPESLGALRELGAADPDAPVIAISDGDDDALGLAAVTAGAQDHLPRAELTPARLGRAIRYAVERKRAESGLARQALADPLTGLPNRVLFGDRLGVALDRSRRTGLAPAVMFLDVDAFKPVNDSLGHAAGDRLLTVLAERFGELLRPMDTVARLGGDEFVFLMEGLSGEAEALAIAQRIREAAARPVDLGGAAGPTSVSVSIGIAMLDESAIAVEDAIGHADAAMYRAKHLGGARAELFGEPAPADAAASAPEPAPVAPASTATGDDEQALATAIRTGQLRVHYQPRVSIDGTTGLVGFEALVRWQHPEHGLIAPEAFIDLAERTGLIVPLGEWVLEQSLHQVRRWRQSRPGVTISVNLSPAQLADPGLADRLGESMRRTGADPSVLWLEVGHAAVASDAGAATEALRRLHHVGVRLAIDDVGRDVTPAPEAPELSELTELPIEMVKIDRSLISGEAAGRDGDAVIGALVDLSHGLGLDVVAEGVETDAQLAHLRELGCDGAQGYLFSRPVPDTAVRELLGV